jgi:ABC-2 type transport system permease protein
MEGLTNNSLHSKLVAVAKRDILTMVRGSTGLGMRFIFVAIELATFYFLAKAVGPSFRPEGLDYFWFLLTGTAVFELLLTSINTLIRGMRDAQISGMLEVLLATSTRAPLVILLDSLSTLVGRITHAVVYIALGIMLFRISLPQPNWSATLAILLLSITLSLALGLIAASLQIWLQKGDSAVALLSVLAALFSGVLFSVDVLPPTLRLLAELNPLSHALTGIRAAALKGAAWRDLYPTLMVLAGYCLVLIPFGLGLFNFALKRARRNGSLLFY